ncbi:MAG: Porphobilinogen deaminase [Chlorobi bacterium]|nr:Porphobilinogen deaminase [Chlorobiota bacterium]
MSELVIATRGSALALWQARAVEGMLLSAYPDLAVRLEVMSTVGDKVLDSPLSLIGDKGLFTKELETALLDGRADIAVHSLKDMQTRLPDGLVLAAVTERHRPEDALVAPAGTTLDTLRHGAVVATGSLRRRAQLLKIRPDLTIVDVRGNVGTRLQKYVDNGWDGMILALAGLERLGFADRIAQIIPASLMIPAVGQGALGIEARAGDDRVLKILAAIEHSGTRLAVEAERGLLRMLEGGCQVPIGGYATIAGDTLELHGVIASVDGRHLVRDSITGPAAGGEALGGELARRLLAIGGEEILRRMRAT